MIPSFLFVVALAASAADNSLVNLLRSKLEQDCSGFCPFDGPSVVFDIDTGSVNATAPGCCSAFDQCDQPTNCRILAEYELTTEPALSEDVCSYPAGTKAECRCQPAFAGEATIAFTICPSPESCCQRCSCYGDPHCTPFGSTTPKILAICDDRDEFCNHVPERCTTAKFRGESCVAVPLGGGKPPLCDAPATVDKTMLMYSKTYAVANEPDATFSTTLKLGLYGSIQQIIIQDGGATYTFGFINGACSTPSKFHLDSGHHVLVSGLPSNINLELKCFSSAKTPEYNRWDIVYLEDANVPTSGTDGFCVTNSFGALAVDSTPTVCRSVDKQLANYLCGNKLAVDVCKKNFCINQTGPQGRLKNFASECQAFVNSKVDEYEPFVAAVCSALDVDQKELVDPRECINNAICKKCMYDIIDYPNPEQIKNVLRVLTPSGQPTGNTAQCASQDLYAAGLARKTLPDGFGGIKIEYAPSNGNGTYTSVWALTDDALGKCPCAPFSEKRIPRTNTLTQFGKYRVSQCFPSKPAKRCSGNPGYFLNVDYQNSRVASQTIGTPFGKSFEDGDIVCNPTRFQNCPDLYKCCSFDRKTKPTGWELCMKNYHPAALTDPKYKDCAL